jgi:hypothetical protein
MNREGRIVPLRRGQKSIRCHAKRVLPLSGMGAGQAAADVDPASFTAPLGQPGIAQDFYVTRYARLALRQNLHDFSHCQFHTGKQAHDPQSAGITKRTQERFDLHRQPNIKPSLYLQVKFNFALSRHLVARRPMLH